MDWFTWLSKTRLESMLVYEYGLVFGNNELEEEDIAYFNHEFLQSMGISIAKHRLEILKLVRQEHKSCGLRNPMSKILFVLRKTKNSLAHYISTLVHHRDDDKALILVSSKTKKINNGGGEVSYSSRLRNSGMLAMESNNSHEILMITNGDCLGDDHMVVSTPKLDSYSSPLMYDLHQSLEWKGHDNVFDDEEVDQNWSPTLEEIRWDAMFHDLKPT